MTATALGGASAVRQALVVLLWRAGLRISEAVALAESASAGLH